MMRAAPAIAVVITLSVFAWHPSGLPEGFAQQDKLLHLLGFAVLAATLRLGLPELSRQEYVAALVLAASAMELGQTFLPARTGSLGDLAADAVGAVLGFALADAWRRWRLPIAAGALPLAMPSDRADVADPMTPAARCDAVIGHDRRRSGASVPVPKGERR
jgi:hypothetical protein